MTLAKVSPVLAGGEVLIWELWWKDDVLFGSTSEEYVRDIASLINLSRYA
jgi:hypothetical protein